MADTQPRTRLKNMPLGLTGLALGIAGISGAWSNVLNISHVSVFGAAAALFLISVILLKYILHPKQFLHELACPVLGSVLPTLDMALMLIASVIVKFYPIIGQSIWIIAVVAHLIFLISFIKCRFKDFHPSHIVPSWFVPPIGIVVASVSGSEMGFPAVSHILFYFGLAAYCLLLPIMLYRIIFGSTIEDTKLPTFAVMGAPANLCLAGYLTSFAQPDFLLAATLAYLGIFTTILVYISFIRIFQIPFSPLYASFTFPLGIGATAMIKYVQFLKQFPSSLTPYIHIWEYIAYTELLIATFIIVYVFIKMKLFIWKNIICTASE